MTIVKVTNCRQRAGAINNIANGRNSSMHSCTESKINHKCNIIFFKYIIDMY